MVIKGDATTAGSKWHFCANKGSIAPISFAIITVAKRDKQTISATISPPSNEAKSSMVINFTKQATDKIAPNNNDTLASFQTTFQKSLNLTSFKAIPRIIIADACEPALPPVPISIGMQDVKMMP